VASRTSAATPNGKTGKGASTRRSVAYVAGRKHTLVERTGRAEQLNIEAESTSAGQSRAVHRVGAVSQGERVVSARRTPALFCPFASGLNPRVASVQPRSVRWAVEQGLVQEGPQADKLARAKIAHLEALVFHDAAEDVLQLAADWTTLFCLLDDHLEASARGPVQLQRYFAALVAAFRAGESDSGDDPVARALLSLRPRMDALASPAWVARFADALDALFDAFVAEERNRASGTVPDLEAYRALRAHTVGLGPQFLLGALAEHSTLSPTLASHPTIVAMERAASLAVGFANDVCTYEKELAAGERHNLLFVLMEEEGRPLHNALSHAVTLHDAEVHTLTALARDLPDAGAEREALVRYASLLRRWVRGHLDWSAQTGRYRASTV